MDNSLILQMEKMAHFIKKGKLQFIMKQYLFTGILHF